MLIRYQEAARRLGMSVGALRAHVARCTVPHLRLAGRTVRFDAGELEEWLSRCRVGARKGEQAPG